MELSDIARFTVEKLFYPKVVEVSKPGLLYNEISKRFSFSVRKKRSVLYFEKNIIDLQKATQKKIGTKKSADLWYKIGKEAGITYSKLSGNKKIPEHLLTTVIDYLFKVFYSLGYGVAEKIEFDSENKSLKIQGTDTIICRETKDPSVICGMVSGILTTFLNENIEAEEKCNKCSKCMIIANRKIKDRYVIKDNSLFEKPKKYDVLNFTGENYKPIDKYETLSDMIKFNKIRLIDHRYQFDKYDVSPGSPEFLAIIGYNYEKIGLKKLVIETVASSCEDIFNQIYGSTKEIKDRQSVVKNIFSVLGIGFLFIDHKKETVDINLLYPPITNFGINFYVGMILGGTNFIYSDRLKIEKTGEDQNKNRIKLVLRKK